MNNTQSNSQPLPSIQPYNTDTSNNIPQLGFLQQQAISESTSDSYRSSWLIAVEYAAEHNIDLNTYTEPDKLLSNLLNELYHIYDHHGYSGYSIATHIVSAYCHYKPQFKHSLPHTRRALKGWKKLKPSAPHPAMSWPAALVIAMTLAAHGRHDMGIALLLQFDCYLRVGELLNIKCTDVLLPTDNRYIQAHNIIPQPFRRPPVAIITLPKTKTGIYQSVSINESKIEHILTEWLLKRQRNNQTNLFSFNQKVYNHYIQEVTKLIGITDITFTSHSARHGGASYDLQRYGMTSIDHIQHRGRWLSTDSVQLYTQGAARAAQQQPLPTLVLQTYNELCDTYDMQLVKLLRSRSCINLRFT